MRHGRSGLSKGGEEECEERGREQEERDEYPGITSTFAMGGVQVVRKASVSKFVLSLW